ncbi:hypothetical protein H0H81_012232 [Sphagnurus paluster]|uniref:Wbp11/ELF5/Saf1 N-terminal domain-containing protein n=1 Tax=Sphagnurus paluster TaxID=117069 RepID=A0A9P7FYC0_9AGAR|nr:hypothetical protein H0H81_012232 [Sphagnurus paluster]
MAKKSLNPADSYRKAQRKKELKKARSHIYLSKARDFALVKKDTWDLEDEIQNLEAAKDPTQQERLAELKAELEKINRKKAEYVEEHPEHRRLVYRPRRKEGDAPQEEIVLSKRRIFDKKGIPIHPERSVYYDPIMNPFGVAPPGMPYLERAPLPGEVWSDDESDEDDDGITMPVGPPPGNHDEDYDVDDIPMPDGPPPSQLTEGIASTPSLPPLPLGPPPVPPVLPSGPNMLPPPPPPPPGLPPNVPGGVGLPPFPLPQGFVGTGFPPLPPGFFMPHPPPGFAPGFPPPFMPNFPPVGGVSHSVPPPPPGFFPRRNQSAMQDPLSSVPHQTFQAHQAARSVAQAHASLPPTPLAGTNPPRIPLPPKPNTVHSDAELTAATVFAAPQLRDFKKEATAFVPTSLKRKKPGVQAPSSQVNAAPGMEDESQEPGPARPDLLSTLKGHFGSTLTASVPTTKAKKVEKKDDYDKFMEEMGDILGRTAK